MCCNTEYSILALCSFLIIDSIWATSSLHWQHNLFIALLRLFVCYHLFLSIYSASTVSWSSVLSIPAAYAPRSTLSPGFGDLLFSCNCECNTLTGVSLGHSVPLGKVPCVVSPLFNLSSPVSNGNGTNDKLICSSPSNPLLFLVIWGCCCCYCWLTLVSTCFPVTPASPLLSMAGVAEFTTWSSLDCNLVVILLASCCIECEPHLSCVDILDLLVVIVDILVLCQTWYCPV